MAEKDLDSAYTERLGRFDVIQFPQLQCLRPEETAESRPACNSHDNTQLEKSPSEKKHEAYYQQYAGDGSQSGINIRDHIVHPSAEKAGHRTEKDSERDGDKGRESSDYESGADPLERLE